MPGTMGIPLHPVTSVIEIMAMIKKRMTPPAVPACEDKT
jgi:hypothetical protein